MTVLLTWTTTDAERTVIRDAWPESDQVVAMDDLTSDELDALLPHVTVMVGYMRTIPRNRLAEATRLRMVHLLGHGADQLLTDEVVALFRDRGVVVARSNPCAIPIAEFVVMNMVALSRRLMAMHTALVGRGEWSNDLVARRGQGVLGGELHGATVGIIGYGNIGREIHARVAAFGMHVRALARRPDELTAAGLELVHPWTDMPAFLGSCDHIVLTLPLTAQTRGLIGREQVRAMRPGSFLHNVSRGGLVDEEALFDGLSSGHLAGAALDVFAGEDTLGRAGYPSSRPLHQFNTVLTPHYSGATAEARRRALTTVGDNLRRLRDGRPVSNQAELDRGF